MRKVVSEISSTTWCRVIALIILLVSIKKLLLSIIHWEKMRGWEAYFIAKAIAKGEGYSFPSTSRWLFDSATDGMYHPTAWVDPLYTYFLAGLIWLFGDYHQLAAAIFNLLLCISAFVLVYHLAERLISSKWAVLAVILLAASDFTSIRYGMNNTYLAAGLIVLAAVMLVNYFEQPNMWRAVLLGLALGVTALGCPSAQLFIPITVLSVIFWGKNNYRVSALHSFSVLVVAIAIMSPWIVRNYIEFGDFISVRNGAGQIVFIGTVATAATVDPEKIASNKKPGWEEESPRKAIFSIHRDYDKRRTLERFQMEYAKEVGPDQWGNMNEYQRDKWFLGEAKEFVLANPLISMQLAAAKIEVFARAMGWYGVVILLLAIAGALATLKKPAVSTVVLWVASYIGPFLLAICYFYRYRAPIEPLLTLLAVYALYWLYSKFNLRILNRVFAL